MAVYMLKFFDDGIGIDKIIQFKAEDPGTALTVAKIEAPDRDAELWEGFRKLCTIRRSSADVWSISG